MSGKVVHFQVCKCASKQTLEARLPVRNGDDISMGKYEISCLSGLNPYGIQARSTATCSLGLVAPSQNCCCHQVRPIFSRRSRVCVDLWALIVPLSELLSYLAYRGICTWRLLVSQTPQLLAVQAPLQSLLLAAPPYLPRSPKSLLFLHQRSSKLAPLPT